MAEQWYWKHGRHLLGPLETEALEALVRQRRVADRDQVRLASDETWLTGAQIKELFAGGDATHSSSEAAARLLSQAARLRDAGGETKPGPGAVAGILLRLKLILKHAGGPVEWAVDRLSDLAGLGLRLIIPLWNRYVLLTAVLLGLAAAVIANLHFGSDARNRRVFALLSQSWEQLERLRARDAPDAEYQALAAAVLPELERDFEALIDDGRRSPGRSADAFSLFNSAERGWEIAHTRKALIQAIQAFRSLSRGAEQSAASSAAREIFQQNMAVARGLLEGGMPQQWSTAQAERPARGGLAQELSHPAMLGFLIIDALLVVAGIWYWRRRVRS